MMQDVKLDVQLTVGSSVSSGRHVSCSACVLVMCRTRQVITRTAKCMEARHLSELSMPGLVMDGHHLSALWVHLDAAQPSRRRCISTAQLKLVDDRGMVLINSPAGIALLRFLWEVQVCCDLQEGLATACEHAHLNGLGMLLNFEIDF